MNQAIVFGWGLLLQGTGGLSMSASTNVILTLVPHFVQLAVPRTLAKRLHIELGMCASVPGYVCVRIGPKEKNITSWRPSSTLGHTMSGLQSCPRAGSRGRSGGLPRQLQSLCCLFLVFLL